MVPKRNNSNADNMDIRKKNYKFYDENETCLRHT